MNKNSKKILIAVLAGMIISASGAIACGKSGKDGKISYSFNTDGGTAIEDVKVEKGEEYEWPIPVKEGYSFEGWFTDASFSGNPVTKIVAQENATYYAKWTKLSVITLDLDGGTLSLTVDGTDVIYTKQ